MSRLQGFYRRMASRGPDGFLQWLLFLLLVPLGAAYGGIGRVRAILYRRGLLPGEGATVPIISVGNLTVGGTGKTPMVDYLVKFCLANDRRVAVVSRGYGGRKRPEVQVVSAGQGPILEPHQCGDEPYLLARRNPQALVLVSPRRKAAVRRAVEEFGAEVILLDDGFQHLAVKRDLDIVLLDARRPFGNGHVLPAGLLREPVSALGRGDLFVLTRCESDQFSSLPMVPKAGPTLRCRHLLSDEAHGLQGDKLPLASLAGKQGVAFAGIAEPEGFFRELRDKGLTLATEIPFADHCAYGDFERETLRNACKGADYLITTEKDGVKLPFSEFPLPCYQVPMTLEFHEDGVLELILRSILRPKDKTS
jgi:tetraacyldisaccharide 4'-kinase